jgi:glycosyltransferase involved in cell wall biosynthesis
MEKLAPRKVFIAHESPDAHFGGKVGGAAEVALQQSHEMHKMGRDVRLIGPQNGGPSRLVMPNTLFKVPELATNDALLEEFKSDKWMSFWKKSLSGDNGEECDVYGHYYVAGDIMNQMNGTIKGRRVYMGHSWDRSVAQMDPDRKITTVRDAAELSILKTSDLIVTSTNAEKQSIAQAYGQAVDGGTQAILNKVRVVPLGVDSEKFSSLNIAEMRKETRSKLIPEELRDSLVFYMVGRVAPQKNQLHAMQAFAEVAKDPKLNISLSLFGGPLEDNPYLDEIREFISTLPPHVQQRIRFHGIVDGEIAHAVGDVFLGPSVWETFFLAGAEAMYAGRPTILSDKPILREVGGQGSLYVDETKVESIGGAIHTMATNQAARAFSSSENFKKATINYTWKASAKHLDEAWKGLR